VDKPTGHLARELSQQAARARKRITGRQEKNSYQAAVCNPFGRRLGTLVFFFFLFGKEKEEFL